MNASFVPISTTGKVVVKVMVLFDFKNTGSDECRTFRSNQRLHGALHNGLF